MIVWTRTLGNGNHVNIVCWNEVLNHSGSLHVSCADAFWAKMYNSVAEARTVKKTTWAEALKQAATEPVFVKSHQWKRLTGMVMRPGEQMGTLAHSGMVDDDPVWVSDLVAFRSEHRVYVVHDTIVAVSQYGEEPDDDGLDLPLIQQAVALMSGYAPRQAYAFDWGILQSGETILIENNDAWAIGAYPGISPVAYYHLLNERWKELVSTSLSLQENNDGQA